MFRVLSGYKPTSDSLGKELSFVLNGRLMCVPVTDISPETSLNTYLRTQLNQNGTKFMCREGGCGVCTVSVIRVHPITKVREPMSVNSCLLPILACDGLEITTIEGLNKDSGQPNIISRRLAENHGSQCGYCSPAMVVHMYSLIQQSQGQLTQEEVERSLGGNICRCTGFRPILDTFKAFVRDQSGEQSELQDIEELNKCANKNNCGACQIAVFDKKWFANLNSKSWLKAIKLTDIFQIFETLELKKYMLLAGNTAHGLYRRPDDIEVFIDINNVAELKTIKERSQLELGGNVTLTQFKIVSEKLGKETNNFAYLEEFAKHLDQVASLSIRNMGTVAGNLMIKHRYPEFVSDIFVLLDVVDAQIQVAQSNWKHKTINLQRFLRTDMKKRLITKIFLPALDNSRYTLRTYKIMNRTQNGSTYVNAAFLYEFQNTYNDHKIVKSARIVFGGVSQYFYHAPRTELYLQNKDIFDEGVLQSALQIVESELNPDWMPPAAIPEVRRRMAIGLFYRSILSIAPMDPRISSRYRSGSQMLERPLSSGIQKYPQIFQQTALGQPFMKMDALIQCSGEAEYVNDMPHLPDDLWATFVLASEVGSDIAYIDARRALALEGVIAFYDAKDIPGINSAFSLKEVGILEREQLFVQGKVMYYNQPAGVLVATSFDLAQRAAELVKITYFNKNRKKSYITVRQVLEDGDQSRVTYHSGQLMEMQGRSDYEIIIEDQIELPGQYYFTLESQTAICVPVDDKLEVYPACCNIDGLHIALSEVLNIPQHKILIEVKRVGGSFGFKLRRTNFMTIACALASFKLKRRVRFVMTIEQMMEALGKRNSAFCQYQVKVDNEGFIKQLNCDYYTDQGIHINEHVIPKVDFAIKNIYQPNNFYIRSSIVRTNKATNSWMRAPNDFDAMAMSENIIEHIAHVTKKDIHQVRFINMDQTTPMPRIYKDFLSSVKFYNRQQEIDEFNQKNRWNKRGIAIMPMKFSVIHSIFDRSANVSIFHGDGTVAISHGGFDMGHGLNTKAAQVAAHVLGIPVNLVTVNQYSTLTDPNSETSGAAITTLSVAYCVRRACEELNMRLQIVRDSTGITDWQLLVQRAFELAVDLTARYYAPGSEIPNYPSYGMSCSEIELDVLTGRILVRRCDVLMDAGQSGNPALDIGQVEGAIVMGLGYWTTEDLVYRQDDGELLTNRTWNFKPPLATDIPVDFRVSLMKNSTGPVLGMKGIGEPPICLASSFWFAVRYALNSARRDAGLNDNWYHIPVPCSPENLILLTGLRRTDMRL